MHDWLQRYVCDLELARFILLAKLFIGLDGPPRFQSQNWLLTFLVSFYSARVAEESHRRELPALVLVAAQGEADLLRSFIKDKWCPEPCSKTQRAGSVALQLWAFHLDSFLNSRAQMP